MDPNAQLDQQMIVRTVIERYFNAIDRRDFDLLATCFTEAVEFEFNLETVTIVRGRDALIARMSGMTRPAASNHALSSTSIVIDGEEASATSFAIAHVVLDRIDGGRVLVRGLRYDDRLAREDGVWRIARRRHNPVWQYETVSVLPRAPQKA